MSLIVHLLICLVPCLALIHSPSFPYLFKADQSINAILEFPEYPHSAPLPQTAHDRQALHNVLLAHARLTQAATVGLLASLRVDFESFWIDNSLHVRKMNASLYETLRQVAHLDQVSIQPDSHIASVAAPHALNTRILDDFDDQSAEVNVEHLRQLRVPQAWQHVNGTAGLVVATIDTGVEFDHPALLASYRGHEWGWLEARSSRDPSPHPHDPHGHGTHTMGSMVGRRVGVAPGLTWMTARACSESGCLRSDLTAAAQWVLCPRSECPQGARIVSNSWGATDPAAMNWFGQIARAWQAAGLLAVFAAGNGGPDCDSIYGPGSLASVLTVGAVNQHSRICSFSSRAGKAIGAKPDVVAPGLNVVSAYVKGKLAEMSGTSMACPLVAGVAGLVWSANGAFSADRVRDIVKEAVDGSVVASDKCCGDGRCAYGLGLVDAEKAVRLALVPE